MGSPRRHGNTAALLLPFIRRMEQHGGMCEVIWLYERDIRPCIACRTCQKDWVVPNCCQQDEMQTIFDQVLSCDLLVFATPIYSWYCTPPMKAAIDRMVYALCKYYDGKKGPSLLGEKPVALIASCGYRPDKGADLWEAGMRRYCKHAQMTYCGMLVERHLGYDIPFMDEEKEEHARQFADRLWENL